MCHDDSRLGGMVAGLRITTLSTMLVVLLLLVPPAAEAQPAGKVHRIGFIGYAVPVTDLAGPAPSNRLFRAFVHGLRSLGYVEGQNLALERRSAEGKIERVAAIVAELDHLKVELLVAASMPVLRAARQATSTIPIVMATSFDPVGAGLVTSLARPGGNVTGIAELATEVVGKRVALLNEAVPGVSRLAVLLGPPDPADPLFLREAEVAARTLGFELQGLRARDPAEFESAFAAMTRERASAVFVAPVPTFFPGRALLAELAIRHRLPTSHQFREFVEAGGLMSYGANLEANFQRAATYVDKILKGAKPADLPVEQPTKFELVINLKTAKALGLTMPASVLVRADRVIE